MRHQKTGRKLGRNSSHRKAMFRNMVTSLFSHHQVETTDAKAKEVRSLVEKMMTLAKKGDLHARRQALAYMTSKKVTHQLFDELQEKYHDRQGGYVRIIKKGIRKGDGAPTSIIQLVHSEKEIKKAKGKDKTEKQPAKTEKQPVKKGKKPAKAAKPEE
jgi:large subunit ribosomal protein L17